jgi:hypothetical protein
MDSLSNITFSTVSAAQTKDMAEDFRLVSAAVFLMRIVDSISSPEWMTDRRTDQFERVVSLMGTLADGPGRNLLGASLILVHQITMKESFY